MEALLDVVLPVFLVLGAGYLATWRKLLSNEAVDALMVFTQKFAFPCLLFRSISRLDLGQEFEVPLLLSYYTGALSVFLLGLFGARTFFKRSWEDSIAIGFVALFANTLMLGIPISERAYGADSLQPNFAIISLNAPFCYMLGVTLMEIARNRGSSAGHKARAVLKSMFSNALAIGIGLGFIANFTGLVLPDVANDAIDLMTQAALPAALFGMGGVLYRYRPEGDIKAILFVVFLSLIVQPAIVWTIGQAFGLSQGQFRAAVLTASMAPGINTFVFANLYGAARRVAASSILAATSLSVLTVWVWLIILG